ncbi:MAG: hypothetical protein PUD03_06700 [Lachnospiraceae bacterium]|nr:hypothetical protein [Lachnospiraceae bacterium]
MLDQNKIHLAKIVNVICLIVAGMYFIFANIRATVYCLTVSDDIHLYFAAALGVVAVVRLFVFKLHREYQFWMAVFFAVCSIISFVVSGYVFLLPLAALMLAVVKLPQQMIYRTAFAVQGFVLLVALLGVQTGAIDDLIYYTERDGIRHSFGIVYPTDFATHLVFLVFLLYVVHSAGKKMQTIFAIIISLGVSYFYCSAKCSVVVLVLLLFLILWDTVCLKWNRVKWINILHQIVSWAKIVAMPLLVVLSVIMTWLYNDQNPYMAWINGFLTNRLSMGQKILSEHGLNLFGKELDLTGAGASLGYDIGYYFIDNGYLMIAVRYGAILLLILCAFYVYTMIRCKKTSAYRLMNVLFLIAVQAVMEHHMIEVWLDVFLLSAVLDLSADRSVSKEQLSDSAAEAGVKKNTIRRRMILIVSALLLAIVFWWGLNWFLTLARTYICMNGFDVVDDQIIVLLLHMIGAALLILLLYNVFKVFSAVWKGKKFLKSQIVVEAVIVLFFIVSGIAMRHNVLQGHPKYADSMQEEKEVLLALTSADDFDGKIYVSDAPAVYRYYFGRVQRTVFTPEVLAWQKNTVFIVPNTMENRVLIQDGYTYTRISSLHGLYTDSDVVREILKNMGYDVSDCYNYRRYYTTEDIVRYNPDIIVDEDGKVVARPWLPLINGPYDTIFSGTINLKMDFSVYNYEWAATDDIIADVYMMCANNYAYWQLELTPEYLDENGHFCLNENIRIWYDVGNVEFRIIPREETQVKINELSYQKIRIEQ